MDKKSRPKSPTKASTNTTTTKRGRSGSKSKVQNDNIIKEQQPFEMNSRTTVNGSNPEMMENPFLNNSTNSTPLHQNNNNKRQHHSQPQQQPQQPQPQQPQQQQVELERAIPTPTTTNTTSNSNDFNINNMNNINNNNTTPLKTPTKRVTDYSKIKRGISPIVDNTSIQSTQSLVQKWENVNTTLSNANNDVNGIVKKKVNSINASINNNKASAVVVATGETGEAIASAISGHGGGKIREEDNGSLYSSIPLKKSIDMTNSIAQQQTSSPQPPPPVTPTNTRHYQSQSQQPTPVSTTKQTKNIMEETKIIENVPTLTRKFSFKENRIREEAKDYNKKANNVNTDLKNNEITNTKLNTKKNTKVTLSTIPSLTLTTSASSIASSSTTTTLINNNYANKGNYGKKRVFVEDDNENKNTRSKRLRISDLKNAENTIWEKVNSSLKSIKDTLSLSKKINNKETENNSGNEGEEKEKSSISTSATTTSSSSSAAATAASSATTTKKNTDLVRMNEPTCLNIFRPSVNVRSSMPMRLRIRRRIKSDDSPLNNSLKSPNSITSTSSSSIYIPFFSKPHSKPNWTNKLYMIILGNEDRSPKLFEVPAHWTSLSSQMVYLLDLSGEAIIQYNGSKSQKAEREYAQRISKRFMLHENIPDVFELDQEASYVANTTPLRLFWRAMDLENYTESERRKTCTKNDQIKLSVVLEEAKKSNDIEKAVYIYRINEQTRSSDLIHCGSFPTYKCLNSSVSMIFDFSGEIYLWQGKNSSLNTRSLGIKFAQKIFTDYSRPSWAVLKKVNEGHEPVIFQEKFEDSYLFF